MRQFLPANLELSNFIFWVMHNPLSHGCMQFIKEKLAYRQRNRALVDRLAFYPENSLMAYRNCVSDAELNYALPQFLLPEAEFAIPQTIQLASMELAVSQNINWQTDFSDPEDYVSLHRWNWVLTLISQQDKLSPGLCQWIEQQIEQWCDLFAAEEEIAPNGDPKWESYTIGERLANSILFFRSSGRKPSVRIANALLKMLHYLLPRLEYDGAHTSNHLTNNARALYLFGVAFNFMPAQELARTIFLEQIPQLIDAHGFLREGSSHYQLLFTRWMLEIYSFALLAQDKMLSKYLATRLPGLIGACDFFVVKNDSVNAQGFPLFGDISPDFAPAWLLDLPAILQSHSVKLNSWNQLWYLLHSENPIDSLVMNSVLDAEKQREWHKLEFDAHCVLARVPTKAGTKLAGHQHNDVLHYVSYYQGLPVLIDSGRKSYLVSDAEANFGMTAAAHNSLLIDDLPPVPDAWRKFPCAYAVVNNDTNLEDNRAAKTMVINTSYARLSPDMRVSRKITLNANELHINDKLQGSGKHKVKLLFHFSELVELDFFDSKSLRVRMLKYEGRLSFASSSDPHINIISGHDSIKNRIFYKYGNFKLGTTLEVEFVTAFPDQVTSRLVWNT